MGTWRAKRDIEYLARPPGQTESAAATSTANRIKASIKSTSLLQSRSLDIFLQGSYANSTNISGASDVDVVSRLEETYYYEFFDGVSDTSQQHVKAGMGALPVTYDWVEYRSDLLAALQAQFPGQVDDGKKAIAVRGTTSGSRLPADVIPCVTFRMYRANGTYEEGICFWERDGYRKIANFPKQHRENMSAKNGQFRAGVKFKGVVRAVKRLRDEVDPNGTGLKKIAASYWVECLLYNVPDQHFKGSYEDALLSSLSFLYAAVDERPGDFMQANGVYVLFYPLFWDTSAAKRLVSEVWDAAYQHIG